jgi:hypothetical protein
MDSVTILRELWRRRTAVCLVALAAILVGLLLAFRPGLPPESRRYDVGIATARMLLDTPQSQVIRVNPRGSDTLGLRANVLANLMVEGPAKASIAKRAGLKPRQLVAIAESELEPQKVPARVLRDPAVNLMRTRVVMDPDGELLPIVEVEAQAPDVARATALANGSVAGLTDFLEARAAADPELNARKRLRVSSLGSANASLSSRGPSVMLTLAAILFVFLAGCTAILLFSALARGWREAEASEHPHADEFTDDDLNSVFPPLSLALDPSERDGGKTAESA